MNYFPILPTSVYDLWIISQYYLHQCVWHMDYFPILLTSVYDLWIISQYYLHQCVWHMDYFPILLTPVCMAYGLFPNTTYTSVYGI